ncbi:Dyp-type peroxidase [Halomicrobium salinisoli]|uniref:Dyp-type peroxidase n=1 Tax=Halomicrobium salinisoli TaxID=2878391 RepID=UPI001CF07F19|nr:Dyp-type peroxidase [Halomicrobium salinisoli]
MSDQRGIPRRTFLKSAVAIGGSAALSACVDRFGAPDVDRGPEDLSALPDRQHAWDEFLSTDDHGNVVPPRHHLLLLVDYEGDGRPTEGEREQVESAFRGLERAYERSNDGLVFTVGYTPAYFERFDDDLPGGVDLPEPEAMAPFEEPAFDTPDAAVHLASDHGQVVMAAEEALKGNQSTLNGVEMPASLSGVLSEADRRSGFVGAGLPAENDDVAGVPEGEVPEDAPLYMGFKSNFSKSQASEDFVTVDEGPFAGGTTQHVSKIRLHLDQWYDQDSRYHREATMFCPVHAEEGLVEGTGENMGDSSGMEEHGCPAHTEEHAREYGKVGHSQKSARAREDGSPLMIRRDFDATDDDRASLHFVSLQETISDFVETREAMNGTDVAGESGVGQRTNNGILQYMTVERRGNYLLPPRDLRALPPARPE